MNKFFSSIGEKMVNNIPLAPHSSVYKDMPAKINCSILLRKCSEYEIREIIKKMSDKTSAGDDCISQKLLKSVCNEIAPILTILINKSIEQRIYPDCLKLTKIVPIYKGGSINECSNFRPISLLSSMNKVFEKKIQNDLAHFIEQNDLLYVKQFGFRKYHSTIDALIATYDFIIEKIRNKKKILGIFIDLKKAFDSIDISILTEKLNYYGISGPYNELLKSYLTNRKIYTYLNDVQSHILPINYGVPQGSVLGPLLFSLYINDIKNVCCNSEINLFADDTCLFCTADNYKQLEDKANETLQKCHNWLLRNRLTINIDKTHFLNFSKDSPTSNINLKLGNNPIVQKNDTKYLGIVLQDNLKWERHITNVIHKLNKQIPLYISIRNALSLSKNSIIYKAISFSLINYGIELYGKKNTKWLKQLQKTQNRLLKILACKPRLFNTNKLHKNFGILKIHDQAKSRLILRSHNFIYKRTKLNYAYKNMRLHSETHCRNTRNVNNFYTTSLSYSSNNTITEQSEIWWNDLPISIKSTKQRDKFKKAVTDHFTYSYT